jgi:hypothetical protein
MFFVLAMAQLTNGNKDKPFLGRNLHFSLVS